MARFRRLLTLGVGACALTVVSCSSSEPQVPQPFHPCEQISADAVAAAGFDPRSTKSGAKNDLFDHLHCSYNSPDFALHAYAMPVPLPIYRKSLALPGDTATGVTQIQVGGREALLFERAGDRCVVTIQAAHGVLEIEVTKQRGEVSACEKAREAAPLLATALPAGRFG